MDFGASSDSRFVNPSAQTRTQNPGERERHKLSLVAALGFFSRSMRKDLRDAFKTMGKTAIPTRNPNGKGEGGRDPPLTYTHILCGARRGAGADTAGAGARAATPE